MSDETAPLLSSVSGEEDNSKHNGYNATQENVAAEPSTANSTSDAENGDGIGVPVQEDKSFKTLALTVSMSSKPNRWQGASWRCSRSGSYRC